MCEGCGLKGEALDQVIANGWARQNAMDTRATYGAPSSYQSRFAPTYTSQVEGTYFP